MRKLTNTLILALALVATACGDDDKDAATECTAGAKECTEQGLRTCGDDGTWGDANPCAEEEICHAMGGGNDHCMDARAGHHMGEGEGEDGEGDGASGGGDKSAELLQTAASSSTR